MAPSLQAPGLLEGRMLRRDGLGQRRIQVTASPWRSLSLAVADWFEEL